MPSLYFTLQPINFNITDWDYEEQKKKVLVTFYHGFVYRTFKIQVLSTLAIKCWRNFWIFHFASTICRQKNCQRLNRNLCILRQQWLWYTLAFCQGLWLGFSVVETTCSTKIISFTYNILERVKQKPIFFSLISLFWFLHVPLL